MCVCVCKWVCMCAYTHNSPVPLYPPLPTATDSQNQGNTASICLVPSSASFLIVICSSICITFWRCVTTSDALFQAKLGATAPNTPAQIFAKQLQMIQIRRTCKHHPNNSMNRHDCNVILMLMGKMGRDEVYDKCECIYTCT